MHLLYLVEKITQNTFPAIKKKRGEMVCLTTNALWNVEYTNIDSK